MVPAGLEALLKIPPERAKKLSVIPRLDQFSSRRPSCDLKKKFSYVHLMKSSFVSCSLENYANVESFTTTRKVRKKGIIYITRLKRGS